MHKPIRRSAKVFHEKDATLIAEKGCALKLFVGGWWEEKVDLTPCKGATPSESRIREIRTCGSMRGRRLKDLLLLCEYGGRKTSTIPSASASFGLFKSFTYGF